MLFDSSHLMDFEDVEPITELGEIHTIDNYKLLLSKGVPIFKMPNKEILFEICQYLSENKLSYQEVMIGDIINDIGVEYNFEQNKIKGYVLSLVSGRCFLRASEDAKLSEQKLSFIPVSLEQTITTLKETMYNKL